MRFYSKTSAITEKQAEATAEYLSDSFGVKFNVIDLNGDQSAFKIDSEIAISDEKASRAYTVHAAFVAGIRSELDS